MVQTQEVIEGWRGVCVALGLGNPGARAVTAGLLAGTASYALKYPRKAFREDGTVRNVTDPTDTHFLLTPLAVATAVYLLT